MNDKQKKVKIRNFVKKVDFFFKFVILCYLRPKLDLKLHTNQPFLPFLFVVNYCPVVEYEELSRLQLG
jgi:hypothetical protein